MAHDTSISPPEDAHVASGITTEVPTPEKPSSMNIEDVDMLEIGPKATYISTGAAAALSQEHRDYLIQRHGTVELDPIPSMYVCIHRQMAPARIQTGMARRTSMELTPIS